ncbi:hypothetical protein Poli38472_003756 [Pythium oligandrum]|uniref:Uncharacterized protein n=1 Tax=Pythium oligandrum TaxID=41045 RepID=A0A8K1CLT5_PYTOL|nr:hypothetical protein Poli38472_003756 [Pythium oligandrum]|eukprot:TMW65991.1 hypothetical protein Poli38472_003756 [Pythium oligandrum]
MPSAYMSKIEPHTVPAKWDASRIQSLKDKIAVVTGANSGIGYETALELARKGAHVVLACRNPGKCADAVKKIQEALASTTEAGKVESMQLDVSDLSSVQRFSEEFQKTHSHLDMLINNAGIMGVPYSETVDGFESQMATNHLGHFALTAQLFNSLKASPASRVVNVSSWAHRHANLKYDEDSILTPESKYDPWLVYSNTKLANMLFSLELARRLEASGITNVTSTVCHPGTTATDIITDAVDKHGWFMSTVWKISRAMPVYQTVEMGALPTLYAATAPGVKNMHHFGPSFLRLWGYPVLEEPSKLGQSESAAKKLWEQSERLTKTSFPVEL